MVIEGKKSKPCLILIEVIPNNPLSTDACLPPELIVCLINQSSPFFGACGILSKLG